MQMKSSSAVQLLAGWVEKTQEEGRGRRKGEMERGGFPLKASGKKVQEINRGLVDQSLKT